MVEYTATMTPNEIKAHGYADIGIYETKSKEFQKLIVDATIKNRYDIVFLILTESIFQAFKRIEVNKRGE